MLKRLNYQKGNKMVNGKTSPAKPKNKNELQIKKQEGKTEDEQLAEISLSSSLLNSNTAKIFVQHSMGEIDITAALNVTTDKVKRVNENDTKGLEEILTAQVCAIDAIFNEMARRAALNMGTHLQATESYMRLALKAQAQCARTIEVIATMKNPPMIIAKQANIAHGHQHVNNGSAQAARSDTHAGKTTNQTNELLSEDKHATMVGRGTTATIGTDKAMATLEKQHRRKDNRREG